MGNIKTIIENNLVGGTTGTAVYPVTSTMAVYDSNNECVDDILKRRTVNISTNYNTDHTVEILTVAQALAKVPASDRVPGFSGDVKTADGWVNLRFSKNNWSFTEADWTNTNNWIVKNLEISSSGGGVTADDVNTILNNKWNTLASVATSGNYNDLSNLPAIGSGTISIRRNNSLVGSFSVNQTTNQSLNITVPTAMSELTNDSKYATETYVSEKIAEASVGGEVDLSSYATKTYVTQQLGSYAQKDIYAPFTINGDGYDIVLRTDAGEVYPSIYCFTGAGTSGYIALADNNGLPAWYPKNYVALSLFNNDLIKNSEWSINGTKYSIHTPKSTTQTLPTIYAPTAGGNAGYLLMATGGTPTWMSRNSLKLSELEDDLGISSLGGPYLPLSGGTLTGDLIMKASSPTCALKSDSILSSSGYGIAIKTSSSTTYGAITISSASIKFGTGAIANPPAGSYYQFYGSAYTTGTWQTSSDMTLKDKIEDILPNFNDVADMPLFSFNWKTFSNEGGPWFGTSAQYWKEKFPIAVKGEEGGYAVTYGELALACTKSTAAKVKELENEVTSLKAEIAELRATVSTLLNAKSS